MGHENKLLIELRTCGNSQEKKGVLLGYYVTNLFESVVEANTATTHTSTHPPIPAIQHLLRCQIYLRTSSDKTRLVRPFFVFFALLQIRIQMIRMFWGLLDPDPLFRGPEKQKF